MIIINNKVLVTVIVPEIDASYDMYLPICKKIGNIIMLVNKNINELSLGEYKLSDNNTLYNALNGNIYDSDTMLLNTDIRNGSILVLLS